MSEKCGCDGKCGDKCRCKSGESAEKRRSGASPITKNGRDKR
jgi:hypothetical protein